MSLVFRPVPGRHASRIVAWLFACLACACALTGHAKDYVLRAAPAWVDTLPVPDAAQSARGSDGTRYLLLDDQVDVPNKHWYRRTVYALELDRALSEGGQFTIDYQPDYQHVQLHAVDVIRDGRRHSRLDDAKVEVLRREGALESGILDGEHTLSITVPDLQVGDIVDYRFSVVGFNPIFGDAWYDSYTARHGVALGLRRVRAIYDAAQPLHWRAPMPLYRVTEGTSGAQRIVDLRASKLQRVRSEQDTPASFDGYGRIELTTAAHWRDIVAWAMPLYPVRLRDRALARTLAERLRLDDPDGRAALERAVAYVQGEIRYTALDMGQNSHAPYPPETTVARRFGDCKDKASLLVALLAEAGVPAQPVLVNTDVREGLASRAPSAYQFDHVVVRAQLDGLDVWIDATRDREGGALEDRTPLPFKLGLPICETCDRLVTIPDPMPRLPEIDVGQVIVLHPGDARGTADFTVVSDYRNDRAAGVRDRFADEGADALRDEYVGYMRGFYDDMESVGDPVLAASEEASATRLRERYRVAWETTEADTFGIVLFQLNDYVPELADKPRLTPLGFNGPRFVRQSIKTRVEGGWSIGPETTIVANRYFRFTRTVRVEGDALRIVGEWRRFSDSVAPADYAQVRKDAERVRELIRYDIDLDTPIADRLFVGQRVGWPVGALAFFGATGVIGWRVRHRAGPAGMLFRPRTNVRGIVDSPRFRNWTFVLLLALGVADVALDAGAEFMAKPDSGIGPLLGGVLAYHVRFAIVVALIGWGFSLLSSKVPYKSLFVATVWAIAPPLLLGYAGAALALGGDVAMLADDAVPEADRMLSLVTALVLLLVGFGWGLVSAINAWSVTAGVSRRHALGASAIGIVACLVLSAPFIASSLSN